MTHRAVLRTGEKDFSLNQNLTTIGNGSCDVIIDSTGTAALHALVEFSQENNGYLLRDLSTEQGTFVNDRRVQAGSPARLAHGDRLRFGGGGGAAADGTVVSTEYQLVVESRPVVSSGASSARSGPLPLFRSGRQPAAPPPHLATVRLGRPTSAGPQIPGRPQTQQRPAAADSAGLASEQRLAAAQFDLHCLQTEAAQRDRQLEELRRQVAAGELESRDRLDALESEVQAKEAQLADLRERLGRGPAQVELRELERLRKDAGIVGGLLAHMQKDMTGKDATISRLAREIESLKETVKIRDQKIAGLLSKTPADARADAEARQVRERELATLRGRLRDAEARASAREGAARDARSALDAAQTEAERREAALRKLGAELEAARAQSADAERSERLVRVDLQQTSSRLERLRSRLMSIAFSTGAAAPEGLATDDQLLDMLARAVDERTELRAEVGRMRAALEGAGKSRALGADAAAACLDRLAEAFGRLGERGRTAARLEDEVALLAASVAEAEAAEAVPEAAAAAAEAAPLRPLTLAVLGDLRSQLRWQRDTETALEACGAPVRLSDASPAQHLAQLRQRWADTEAQLTRTRTRLAEVEARIATDMDGQTEWLRLEAEARLADALAAAAAEARRERELAVEAAVAAEAERRREAAEREAAAFRAAIADLESALKRRRDDEAAGGRAAAAELEELRASEARLRAQLAALEDSGAAATERVHQEAARRAAETREQLEQSRRVAEEHRRLAEDLEASKRQVGRLQSDLERLQGEAVGLQRQLVEQQQRHEQDLQLQQQQQRRPSVAAASVKAVGPPPTPPPTHQPHPPTPPPPPPPLPLPPPAKIVMAGESDGAEAASLRRENASLRAEVARLAARLAETEAKAAAATASAAAARTSHALPPPAPPLQQPLPQPPVPRSSDQLEASKRRQRAAEEAAAASQSRLEKLTELMERQRGRLAEKEEQLEKLRAVVKKLKTTLEARDAQTKETERKLADAVRRAGEATAAAAASAAAGASAARDDDDPPLLTGGALEAELAALGHQCRGERHSEIIQHQREALSELRRQLRDSELGKPTKTNHDHTAQQVALLKRELAAMRARQALSETGRLCNGQAATVELNAELGSTGLARIATASAELQTERTARSQAAECLDASERTYLTLARAVASALRLESLPGQLPMSQMAGPEERRGLAEERDTAAGLMAERARQLAERAERKDQLLLGYEGDLARLRQALQLAEARTAQVDALAEQLRTRTEETQLLRESLGRARTAGPSPGPGVIVVKRTGRAASARAAADAGGAEADAADGNAGRHNCLDSDCNKEAERKRAIRERVQRKDYEITALKAELRSREKDLRNANTKLNSLRTTLGLPHESELTTSN